MKRSELLQKFELYIISFCLLFLLIIVITVDPRLYVDTSVPYIRRLGDVAPEDSTSIAALLFTFQVQSIGQRVDSLKNLVRQLHRSTMNT